METFRYSKKACAHCGKELPAEQISYEPGPTLNRLYCSSCQEIGKVKETWMPIGPGYSVAGIFKVNSPIK